MPELSTKPDRPPTPLESIHGRIEHTVERLAILETRLRNAGDKIQGQRPTPINGSGLSSPQIGSIEDGLSRACIILDNCFDELSRID